MNEENDKEKGKEERKTYAPTFMSLDVNVLIVYFLCCLLTFLSLRENNECIYRQNANPSISFHPIQRLFFIFFFQSKIVNFGFLDFQISKRNFWMLCHVNETLKNPGYSAIQPGGPLEDGGLME